MIFVLLLVCTIVGGGMKTASTGGFPDIYVDPEITNTAKGSDFTIDIDIDNVTWANTNYWGVFGWEFRMNFSASLIEVVPPLIEGPWLKSAMGGEKTLFQTSIDNAKGEVIATNFLKEYPDEGAVGNGTLASITFHTLAEGTCPLHFYMTALRYYDWDLGDLYEIPHNITDGSVTVAPGHDVAVVSITAPSKARVNGNVPINVTVQNEGSFTENGNVTLYYNTTEIGTQTFTNLASGASTNASFTWNTAGRTPGPYILNATVTMLVENDTTDNSDTKPLILVEHDIGVTDIDAPIKATIESTIPVNVTVENLGGFTEAFNLTITYWNTTFPEALIGFNDTAQLPVGNSSIISFSWNTSGSTPGKYNITATATILSGTDDDPTDNSKIKLITLQQFHRIEVVSIIAEAVAVNSTVPIKVEVENEGSYVEEVNVTLYYTPVNVTVFIDSQNVTMAPLTSTTVTLTWDTTGVGIGSYVITANATIQTPGGVFHDFLEDTVSTMIACDVNGDNKVDVSDLSDFMEAYGSERVDPNWNPRCNFNWDNKIDGSDLFSLGKNYGQTI